MGKNVNPGKKYHPTADERKLSETLFRIMATGGFEPIDLLDNIIETEEKPPKLNMGKGNHTNGKSPSSEQDQGKGKYDIEEVLGVYVPDVPQIKLYNKGIKACSDELEIPEPALKTVVLIHELGHWVTHLFPYKAGQTCNRKWENYLVGYDPSNGIVTDNVHEGWAQLLTWWVVEKALDIRKSSYHEVFEILNKNQSDPYRVYREFKDKNRDLLLKSLVELRIMSKPNISPDLSDWQRWFLCKSWENYLNSLSEAAVDEDAGLALVKCNLCNIEYLRFPTYEMQDYVLKTNPALIAKIKNLHPELKKYEKIAKTSELGIH